MDKTIDNDTELDFIASKFSKQFHYTQSLIKHWLETLGIESTITLLQKLREPYESLWVQIDVNRTEPDSVMEIFEEMELKVKKHPHFPDVLLVSVERSSVELEKDLPAIIVDREAASSIALGKDVNTSFVVATDTFKAQDKVKVIDRVGNILAIAITEVSSSEIRHLPQRVVARVKNSIAKIPPLTEFSLYRQGYFTILSPIQILGIKSMYISKQDSILVMSVDKGEVATTIAQMSNHEVPITVIAQNQSHAKAIRKQIKRVKTKAIRLIVSSFYNFLSELHDIKYSSVFLELPNSRTAVMPTFNSNLTKRRLKKMNNEQIRILDSLYKALISNTSITYITHSIDVWENEQLFNQVIQKNYYESQSFPQELRTLQKNGELSIRERITLSKIRNLFEERIATVFLDPRVINNTGGYLMKFKYVPKPSSV